ncbi:XrtA/PEP-CTERM system-associated ATPase [Aliiglaciecola aliphaticivorans]
MYENYYGLTSKPFQLTPDPSFFFASKWHKRAMSYLQYGLSQAEGFIVITGDIGTGKTTIANSLLDNIEDDIVAAQIVTPKLSPDELVKMVASKFEVGTLNKTKADILKDLEKYLFDLHKSGKRALLIVDEAQNLPLETIEELRMLSNFQQQGKPLLQSFLLGQEELQPILRAPNMEQFRQRIVASCHLAPLNEPECREYIEYRLKHAGLENNELFADGAFDKIFKFTNGVPRRVNTLMDRILLYGFLEELTLLDETAVDTVTAEVADEMFRPEEGTGATQPPLPAAGQPQPKVNVSEAQTDGGAEVMSELTPDGRVKDVQYYKTMLNELTDALDDAISHKIKLTRYIDNLLKKKYKTYVRLKSDD